MKITFRGWRREVTQHERKARPVSRDGSTYNAGDAGKPIQWHDATRAFARLDKLALNGSFLLEIEWDDAELRSWLEKYSIEKPEAAIRLLSEMQAEALLALHAKPLASTR